MLSDEFLPLLFISEEFLSDAAELSSELSEDNSCDEKLGLSSDLFLSDFDLFLPHAQSENAIMQISIAANIFLPTVFCIIAVIINIYIVEIRIRGA